MAVRKAVYSFTIPLYPYNNHSIHVLVPEPHSCLVFGIYLCSATILPVLLGALPVAMRMDLSVQISPGDGCLFAVEEAGLALGSSSSAFAKP